MKVEVTVTAVKTKDIEVNDKFAKLADENISADEYDALEAELREIIDKTFNSFTADDIESLGVYDVDHYEYLIDD